MDWQKPKAAAGGPQQTKNLTFGGLKMKKILTICVTAALVLAISRVAQGQPKVWAEVAPGEWQGYTTIQAGINNVMVAGQIYVEAGMFQEDLVIPAGKDGVELFGEDPSTTIIKGVDTEPWGNWPLANPNIEILASGVSINGFTIESPDVPDGNYSSGVVLDGTDVEICDDNFVSIGTGDAGCVAIQTYRDNVLGYNSDISGLNIHDNEFSGTLNGGYVGVFINHTLTGSGTVTVQDNTFVGTPYQGVVTERSNTIITGNYIETTLDYTGYGIIVMDWDERDQNNVEITCNTIAGDPNGFAKGILIGDSGHTQALTDIMVTNNNVLSNNIGVQVRSSADGVVVNSNRISGNTTFGVQNTDADDSNDLDAELNWWGDASGPYDPCHNPDGLGDPVSSKVDYSCWYDCPDMNDCLRCNEPILNETKKIAYYTIAEALEDADPCNVICVTEGNTYPEDLTINKLYLTLHSQKGAASTIIKGQANVDITQWPLAVPNIEILADGVEIYGFTIQGPDWEPNKYSSGMVIGGDNVEIHHNIIQVTNANSLDEISQGIQTYRDGNGGAGDLNGLYIHDNTFQPWGSGTHGYEAIFINHTPSDPSPVGTVTIQGNTITGAVIRGITTERSNVTLTGNTIETTLEPFDGNVGAFQGINIMDYGGREQKDVTVSNNVFRGSSGFSQGIRVGGSGQTLANISVTHNTLQAHKIGVLVRASADGVAVNYNNISDSNANGVESTNPNHTLDAEYNWWGDATGPYDPCYNPDGKGDAVSAYVDYEPWLTVPFCYVGQPYDYALGDLNGDRIVNFLDLAIIARNWLEGCE